MFKTSGKTLSLVTTLAVGAACLVGVSLAGPTGAGKHLKAVVQGSIKSPTAGFTKFCGMGFNMEIATLTPANDSTNAAAVQLIKRCAGPVVGTFSSEVTTFGASDFIDLEMFAVCMGTAGLPNPCDVGSTTAATPGSAFFRHTIGAPQTQSMQMVWPNLLAGRYAFFAVSTGNNHAQLGFRTFSVEAFALK